MFSKPLNNFTTECTRVVKWGVKMTTPTGLDAYSITNKTLHMGFTLVIKSFQ